jgi:two-component system, chemotaxis family, protein-glutamate methylesterase/glutaminase
VPKEGEYLRRGRCYLGTPDHHLTVDPGGRVHLVPDSFYRAHNIDIMFSSLARHMGRRTIGVVLSGLLKDGTLGLRAIKETGGVALVQSPEEADYPDMPMNAIVHDGTIDFIGPIDALASEICRRVLSHPPPGGALSS